MTEIKFSELAEITSLDEADILAAVHLSEGINGSKKITVANLRILLLSLTAAGLLANTGSAIVQRTIAVTAGHLSITNGNGAAGNPTLGLPNVGTTVNIGTAAQTISIATDAQGRVTACSAQAIAIAQSQVASLVSDLSLKAPLASPALTGNPTAPTPTIGDSDTSIATSAFVMAALAAHVALTDPHTQYRRQLVYVPWGEISGVPLLFAPTLHSASHRAGGSDAIGYFANVGDGVSTDIVITHNLNTRDVLIQVYDKTTPYAIISPSAVERTTVNTVTLRFGSAPTTGQYRVVIK